MLRTEVADADHRLGRFVERERARLRRTAGDQRVREGAPSSPARRSTFSSFSLAYTVARRNLLEQVEGRRRRCSDQPELARRQHTGFGEQPGNAVESVERGTSTIVGPPEHGPRPRCCSLAFPPSRRLESTPAAIGFVNCARSSPVRCLAISEKGARIGRRNVSLLRSAVLPHHGDIVDLLLRRSEQLVQAVNLRRGIRQLPTPS